MQGLIINNTHFEFLRPALERWVDCIDRFNQLQGDADAPYWHGSAANVGMLAAAAWQGELVALQQYQSKKQRDEGEREGRCDLSISNAEASVHLHAGQRWPRIARLDLASALQETAAQARHIGYASQLKAGALFVTPGKPASTPARRAAGPGRRPAEAHRLRHRLVLPYAYRKLHNELGQYFPGVALLLKQA
jgi:hypothetical protein